MKVFYLPRRMRHGMVLTAVLLVLGFCAALLDPRQTVQSVFQPSSRALPIYSVETDQRQVALSLDAAWGDEQTEAILDILDRYQVKATFFLVGYWVDTYPEDVKAIAERGHVIGNHSSTHPHMSELSAEAIRKEVAETNAKITALTGQEVTLFRPPYGDYDELVVNTVREMGMEIVQWDVDSLDWKDLNADEILSRVKEKTAPGSILLFHNNSTHILPALEATLDYLTGEGYDCVTLDKLILWKDYGIDHTGRQYPLAAKSTKSPVT